MPLILLADEIMEKGLAQVGFALRQQRVARETNLERFKYFFGCLPTVLAHVWEDLQKTNSPLAVIKGTLKNLKYFFLACHMLKGYKLKAELAETFQISKRTVCDVGWKFVKKFRRLK